MSLLHFYALFPHANQFVKKNLKRANLLYITIYKKFIYRVRKRNLSPPTMYAYNWGDKFRLRTL